MPRFFRINGYWKDNWSQFSDYIVTDATEPLDNDIYSLEDIEIFHYEMSEEVIKETIKLVLNSPYEFVISSYREIQ